MNKGLEKFEIINSYLSKIKDTIKNLEIDLDKYEIFYRGESKYHNETIPGVFREDDGLKREHKEFRELELRYPAIFDSAKSTIDKLAIMQHYGLPTRLIDFTTNPLLALYMAIDSEDLSYFCPTIKIVCVKKDKIKYYDSDTVSVFSNFAKMDYDKSIDIYKKQIVWIVEKIAEYYEMDYDSKCYSCKKEEQKIEGIVEKFKDKDKEIRKLLEIMHEKSKEDEIKFTDLACISSKLKSTGYPKKALSEGFCYAVDNVHYLLHLIKDEKPYFKDMIWMEHLDEDIVFLKPKHNSQRLINQAGLFALFGLKNGKKIKYSLEDIWRSQENKEDKFFVFTKLRSREWISNNKCLKYSTDPKYREKKLKKEVKGIMNSLAILGITGDKVYPEMEHASKFIKKLEI